jgi:hypothetical protein
VRLVGAPPTAAAASPGVPFDPISAAFPGADALMREAVFLGTFPGLTPAMVAYEISVIRDFVKGFGISA